VETNQGIQGELTVAAYDQMQRKLRDKGWIETRELLKREIIYGLALEIGPGPGYLGLEWLKHTEGTTLKGLDISPEMIAVAARNAGEYSLSPRVEYVCHSSGKMPFDDGTFDAVFTNGSLHEWAEPRRTFDEIWRVLKPGGRMLISDLRRDMVALVRWFLWLNTEPRAIRPGLITSINAAYTPRELRDLIRGTRLAGCRISGNPLGLLLSGRKQDQGAGMLSPPTEA
jgi:ubiquinone/menaquinone biosynthesis C-methylase UbiE